jgi:hypothetical protein
MTAYLSDAEKAGGILVFNKEPVQISRISKSIGKFYFPMEPNLQQKKLSMPVD